ncbi:M48 family metallopeptidase [Corallococcus sp. RDP092CA]|uniref:M48 family metallopeptidase n=1 Tax=Corallococcus sp. RDP092CA TaxID=3109369 RepID=UPI0035B4C4F2
MSELLLIGGVHVEVVKRNIKNVHLTVHPPEGRVRIAAPQRMQKDAIRLFAISKLPWIRRQQDAMRAQEREPSREYLDRESHYVWGRRYLLRITEREAPAAVELGHREMVLYVRPGADEARRQDVLALWYRDQLRLAVAPLMKKWASALCVRVERLFVQQMTTKWGSCNPTAATIRLNTELAKKPPECMEYVLVHELVHLIEPTHGDRFRSIMDQHLPQWPHLRDELNRAPLAHVDWNY